MSTPGSVEALAESYGPGYRWWVAATVLPGMLGAVLTTTIVNVAIPDIMGAFGINHDVAHWLSTGALAGTSVAMLVQAWLAARFGPRRAFVWALAVFCVSLLVAAFARDERVLILARVAQGAIAGMMQPLAIYMLFRVFPSDRKGQAMGMFGLVAVLGPALGPVVGGLVIEHFSWRAIFYVSMPIALAAMALGAVFLPEKETPEDGHAPAPFDWWSFALAASAIGGLLVVLSTGQGRGWGSSGILLSGGSALACAAGFVLRQLKAEVPLVNVRLLMEPNFGSAALLGFIFGAGLFGSVYLVPLFAQSVQGLTPTAAGLLLMPGGLVLAITMPISGYLADRMPARLLIVTGMLLYVVSSIWLAGVDVNTSFLALAVWVSVGRFGLALVNPALNVASLRAVPPNQLGQGAGIVNFARQLGGAFGVSVLALVLDRGTAIHGAALTVAASASGETHEFLRLAGSLLVQAGASPGLQEAGALHFLGEVIGAQALSLAFKDGFYWVAISFMLALVPACIVGREARTTGSGRPP